MRKAGPTVVYLTRRQQDRQEFERQMGEKERLRVLTFSTASDVLEHVKATDRIDCIVSDHDLPDVDGITLLEAIRVQYPDLPFILFTDSGDEQLASRAISSGVTDYLIKSQMRNQWEELRTLITEAVSYYDAKRTVTTPELAVKSILQASPDPMAIVQSGTLAYGNDELLSLFEADSIADIAEASAIHCFDTEARESTTNLLKAIQQGERVLEQLEQTVVALDGTTTAVEVTATAIQWDERSAVLLICRNISERRERETKLSQFEKAVEASGHAVYITDPEGTIQYVNGAFEDITGYEASEALGENPRILNSGKMSDEHFETLWETITAGKTWEETAVNRRKDGEIYHADQTIAPITDTNGDIIAFVATLQDITNQKRRERELEQYRRAVHNTDDLLAAVDRNDTFIFANPRYREFHGVSPDTDASEISLTDVVSQDEFNEIEPRLDRVLDGEHVPFETLRTNANGEERRLNVQYFPLRDENGVITGIGASMRDTTERQKLIEDRRRLAEFRRVMNEVHRNLIRVDAPRNALSRVTDIIASSTLFECAFFAKGDRTSLEFVCDGDTARSAEEVKAFHSREYLDTVFEQGVLKIDDVTTGPFKQHSSDQPPHQGVAIAVSHENELQGVLTAHIPTDAEIEDDEIGLLRQLADDIGLVLHNHALEQRYRTFQEIANRIEDPIMLQNPDGEFEVVNDAVCDYTGLSKTDLRGEDEYAFMESETAKYISEMKERVLDTEQPIEYEITADLPESGTPDFATVRYPHYDDTGQIDGTVAICRDVTDLNEYERQMKVIERILRHNVRNHMTVIQGLAERIQSTTADARTSEHASKIVEHSHQLTNIVEKERQIMNLLSDPPKRETIDLVSMTEATVMRLQEVYPSVEFCSTLPEQCVVQGSSVIEDAVEELLRNAITHSQSDDPSIEVTVSHDGETGSIQVADRNTTIPKMERDVLQDASKIEPLYHGRGLGLWLVNHIVRESAGSLIFRERQPEGNEITIRLSKLTHETETSSREVT